MRADRECAPIWTVSGLLAACSVESTTTLVRLTVASPVNVMVSPLSVAFVNVAVFGVPPGMLTVSPLTGTASSTTTETGSEQSAAGACRPLPGRGRRDEKVLRASPLHVCCSRVRCAFPAGPAGGRVSAAPKTST